MELTPYLFWNIFITLVLAPLMYGIRQNASELKRQDILLNKTREEIAKYYVTKDELLNNMDAVMDRLEKLDEKIDKLFELKYK
jgi:archaellum component FlaC